MRSAGARSWAAGAVLAAGLASCGPAAEHANRPRPPASIDVTAAIAGGRIHLSRAAFGAGPVVLLIANQTARPQRLTFETADSEARPGITVTSPPIAPAGTATVEVDVPRGRYRVRTNRRDVRPASVRVGPARRSAQDALLSP